MVFQVQSSLFVLVAVALVAQVANAKPPRKIAGAQTATPGEFPYQVSVHVNDKHSCGGTIISERHILTAAHCVAPPIDARNLRVFTGSLSIRSGGQAHRVSRVVVHEGYSSANEVNDIAIIVLSSPIPFNASQKKLKLSSKANIAALLGTITGWASVDSTAPKIVDGLRKVNVYTMDPTTCQQKLARSLYTSQVCTADTQGHGTCTGDSGGPLANNGQLIGVLTSRAPCNTTVPNVFANVYTYVPWINDVLATQ